MNAITAPAQLIAVDLRQNLGLDVKLHQVRSALASFLGYFRKEESEAAAENIVRQLANPSNVLVLNPERGICAIGRYLEVDERDFARLDAIANVFIQYLLALAPGRSYVNQIAFRKWFSTTHLLDLVEDIPVVATAQSKCRERCTAFLDETWGHDEDQFEMFASREGAWNAPFVGQFYPVDSAGKMIRTLDWVGINAWVAFPLRDRAVLDMSNAGLARISAWATRYDAGMGGIEL